MARILDRPIRAVQKDPQGRPQSFAYEGRRYTVTEVLDEWREIGPWWEQDPPEERTVYRVRLEGDAVAEIDYREPPGQWYLYKLYD